MFRRLCTRQHLCRHHMSLDFQCFTRVRVPRGILRTMASSDNAYATWDHQDLVGRVLALEKQLKEAYESKNEASLHEAGQLSASKPAKARLAKKPKIFDWSKYNTRFIALKFAYLGRQYNGFEHHANNHTPLPTVEETLWHALMKAKLINPTGQLSNDNSIVDWEGCEYSKCGRTDRGVSAFGQVIGIRVRSNRPKHSTHDVIDDDTERSLPSDSKGSTASTEPFDDLNDEIPYIQILNGLLPSDIRILAWCPNPPEGFSARFSCRARHYKYFFTQPAYTPTPGPSTRATITSSSIREGWLAVARMQEAAKRFEGLHDFRNFCKIDPSKQISDHRRHIFRSEIRPLTPEEQPAAYITNPQFSIIVSSTHTNSTAPSTIREDHTTPQIYVFDLQGSAFLWHQVRHMVAVLFLIGQGLETPDVIDRLLDTESFPSKPVYGMADETPLVLWDCAFAADGSRPDINMLDAHQEGTAPHVTAEGEIHHNETEVDPLSDSLAWVYASAVPAVRSGRIAADPFSARYGRGGIVDTVWGQYRAATMDAVLAGTLLNRVARQPDVLTLDPDSDHRTLSRKPDSQKVFQGAALPVYSGTYIPLLKRERLRSVEVQNREYAERKALKPPKK